MGKVFSGMCGIAGYINYHSTEIDKHYIEAAIQSLKKRGPDDDGYYATSKACIINTRLSIIDINNGHQPFQNSSRDIHVVQNGEIYNFIEVKEYLEKEHGLEFESNSDTEVILKAYEAVGQKCFSLFNGMFAIAILDEKKNKLILGRDRLGVKPLYYSLLKDKMFFSSEIKTFLKIPEFDKSINNQSIHNYLKFNYIPIPETIFKNVWHVKPGTFLEIDLVSYEIVNNQYWEISNERETERTEEQTIDLMEDALNEAIKIRLRSDVEIGAFLSGGLDSSLICAMTMKNHKSALNTFSIGFPEKRFDESEWAKKVADLYGLRNNTNILDADIIEYWNDTTWFNDQPHGDISFIPTYLLSEFASKSYKVVFTGDGGDEFCGGYTKYFEFFKSKDHKDYFNQISLIKDNSEFTNIYSDEFKNSVNLDIPFEIYSKCISEVSNKDNINKILYFDVKHLLPGNNLVKPDKMAMANSLETRSPMLDYKFLELMQTVPGDMKVRNQETKYLLKKLALRYLPQDIVYRDKQMFTVPVGEWFKNKLKTYIIDLLKSKKFQSRGIFNQEYINFMIEEHTKNKKDFTRELRAIANLEIWFQGFIDT